MIIEDIAKIGHDLNRSFCQAIGDDSQLPWDEAPEWQKDSSRAGVLFVEHDRYAGDRALHDAWLAQKEKDGWTYGEVKDPEKKTHPCCVPFEQLPFEQQLKDKLFRQTVIALLPLLDK